MNHQSLRGLLEPKNREGTVTEGSPFGWNSRLWNPRGLLQTLKIHRVHSELAAWSGAKPTALPTPS